MRLIWIEAEKDSNGVINIIIENVYFDILLEM